MKQCSSIIKSMSIYGGIMNFFDDDVLALMEKKKYRKIYDRVSKAYNSPDHPLNAINLIRDFLLDLDLKKDFLDYCKMRYRLEGE